MEQLRVNTKNITYVTWHPDYIFPQEFFFQKVQIIQLPSHHTDLKTSLQYLTEKYLNIYISKGTIYKSLNNRSGCSLWQLGSS